MTCLAWVSLALDSHKYLQHAQLPCHMRTTSPVLYPQSRGSTRLAEFRRPISEPGAFYLGGGLIYPLVTRRVHDRLSPAEMGGEPVLTLPGINPGGSWFRELTCHGTLAGAVVEAVSPQAFIAPPEGNNPFPCAPRYGRTDTDTGLRGIRPRGGKAPSSEEEVLRCLSAKLHPYKLER